MKKLIIISLLAVVPLIQANYSIQWRNIEAGFQVPGPSPITPNIGDTIALQLLFSPSGIIDNTVLPGGTPGGDNVVLATEFFTNTTGLPAQQFGNGWTFAYGGAGTPFLGPNVFMRVFSTQSIDAGDWFINSPVFSVTPKDFSGPAPVADIIEFTGGLIVASHQVIPEPGTVALFLMGGVMMMIRHRRKRFLGR